MTNLTVVETDPIISSLSKKTAYDLMASLASRLDEYFVATGPRKLRWRDSLRALAGRALPPISSRFRDVDAAAAFENGTNRFQQLEYASAREAFEQTTKADPQAPMAFAWLARTSQILQQADAAQQAAFQAVRLLRSETPAHDALLVHAIDAEARHDSTAEAQYRDASQIYFDDPAWLVELAAFDDRQTRSSDAISTYQRALAMEQAQPGVHLELCRLYGRTNEPAKAKQEGDLALTSFRTLGNRGGEALALMCLTNVLRLGDPASQTEARRDAAVAVSILEQLEAPYNLARAYYYVALAAESQGPAVAVPLYESALTSAQSAGNVVLEPLVLMNLGALNGSLGRQSRALDYHQQSLALWERFGDERRVAQLRSNIGSILIEYGGQPDDGLRYVENARAIFRKLGDAFFEVFAMKITALSLRYAGRLDDAEHELNRALALARERDLRDWIRAVTIDLGIIRFELGDYPAAQTLFRQSLPDSSGKDRTLALVGLGRTETRLGAFDNARSSLAQASNEATTSGMAWLVPAVRLAAGELAEESGQVPQARAEFERAAKAWVDDLPETASIEARSHLGLLDAVAGQLDRGRQAIDASVKQARKTGARWIEVECLLDLAQLSILEHRSQDALAALKDIPADGDRAVGRELQSRVHYWRARALQSEPSGLRDQQADAEYALARKLVDDMAKTLPEEARASFLKRPGLALTTQSSVR
jgi:tetratricopeptide (TPR) repeat protein